MELHLHRQPLAEDVAPPAQLEERLRAPLRPQQRRNLTAGRARQAPHVRACSARSSNVSVARPRGGSATAYLRSRSTPRSRSRRRRTSVLARPAAPLLRAPPRHVAQPRLRHQRRNAAVALGAPRQQRHRVAVHLQLHAANGPDPAPLRLQREADQAAHVRAVRHAQRRVAQLGGPLHQPLRRRHAVAERECRVCPQLDVTHDPNPSRRRRAARAGSRRPSSGRLRADGCTSCPSVTAAPVHRHTRRLPER
jgi:hypothetical protein